METWAAIAGIIFAGAITPGPNNLLVFRSAIDHDVRATLPAIGGVVAGGLVMLGVLQLGLARVLHGAAWLRDAAILLGACYLAWMGLALAVRRTRTDVVGPKPGSPAPLGARALFGLQFVNPKGWTLFLTVAALSQATTIDGNAYVSFVTISALFVVISFLALMAWTALGRLAARGMRHPSVIVHLDRIMGALLIAMAGMLILEHADSFWFGAA